MNEILASNCNFSMNEMSEMGEMTIICAMIYIKMLNVKKGREGGWVVLMEELT